jgi:ATP-dependent DNA ligase
VARPTSKDKDFKVACRRPRDAMPAVVSPQLATLASRPPVGEDWTYEIKFDGYCVFRTNVTGDFGNVTGHFGNVTERTGRQEWRCA